MTGSYKFTFLTCQRAVIYHKMHGDGRLGDLLERDRFRIFHVTQGITDVNLRDTGNSNDRTDACFLYFYFIQTFKFIQFTYLYFFLLGRIVMVHQHHFLVDSDLTVVYFTDTDTTYIFIVVDGTDQNLGTCIRITLRSRDVF